MHSLTLEDASRADAGHGKNVLRGTAGMSGQSMDALAAASQGGITLFSREVDSSGGEEDAGGFGFQLVAFLVGKCLRLVLEVINLKILEELIVGA